MNTKKSLLIYTIITYTVTWLFWLPSLLTTNGSAEYEILNDILLKIGTFIPTIIGLVLAMIIGKKNEAADMLRSLIKFRCRLYWYLYTFLNIPAVMMVTYFVYKLLGGTVDTSNFSATFILPAFFIILFLMGPLGEEAGWRGFALKRLLHFWSPLKSAFVLGLIWALWHSPLFFINGTVQNDLFNNGRFIAFFGYIVYTIMISLHIAVLYVKTNGSILITMIFHTMSNLVLGICPLFLNTKGAVIFLIVLTLNTIIVYLLNKTSIITKRYNEEAACQKKINCGTARRNK